MNKPGEPSLPDGVPSETRVRLVDDELARDSETLLDILAALLADEEQIVGSGPDPGQNCSEIDRGSTPLFQSRLDRARDCLQLLKLAWSRAGGVSEPDTATKTAGAEAEADARTAKQSPAPEHDTEAHGEAPAGREAAQEKDELGPRKIGRFTILRELGQGGFGIVYLARDPTLSRLVALKLPRLEILASPDHKRRFLVEAQAAARLDHPNILPIYDVGELGPHPSMGLFIASAYCRDGSLSGWIARQHAAIAPRLAARLMLGLAQGVECLHEQGILHRDLKPSNVLLQRSVAPDRSSARPGLTAEDPVDPASIVPRIADFGLARLMDQPADQTQSGHPLGSPPYMSPEQAEGRISAMGPATDIYGLGAILYTLLVGRPPFRAETPALTIRQVIEDEPISPRKLRPGLPRDLETICLTCLHKSPERRYASAAALREDLNRWLEGQPIHARPVSSAERAIKWARRRPAIATLSVILFLAVSIGLAGVLWQWRRAEDALVNELQSSDIADHHAYVADINLAARDSADGHIDRARHLLDQARPRPGRSDLRGFEWYYLDQLSRNASRTLAGHTKGATCAAFRPGGTLLATGGEDKTVRIWDLARGILLKTLGGPNPSILRIAYHPGGTLLAAVGTGGRVVIWDTEAESVVQNFAAHDSYTHDVAFHPGGRMFATAGQDGTVKLWDLEHAKLLRSLVGHAGPVFCVRFSPDGSRLVSAGKDGVIRIWDPTKFDLVESISAYPPAEGQETGAIQQLQFSPDGASLASCSGEGTIKIWNWKTDRLVKSFPRNSRGVWCVAFSPDGRALASGDGDHLVSLWDLRSGALLRRYAGHEHLVLEVAFSADGQTLASVAGDDRFVKLWEPARNQESRILTAHDGSIFRVRFNPRGQTLASAGEDGQVKIWDCVSARPVATLKQHKGPVYALSYTRQGSVLATGGEDRAIRLWDAATGELIDTLAEETTRVRSLAFDHSGAILFSVSDEGEVVLWDVPSRRRVSTLGGNGSKAGTVASDPQARQLATASLDGPVRLFNLSDPLHFRIIANHAGGALALCFSPDGSRLASAGIDRRIRMIDWRGARQELSLEGHSESVVDLAFSPDGRRLASAGFDQMVRVWESKFGEELLTFRHPDGPFWSVAFSPDGRRLAASGNGTIFFWEGTGTDSPR